MGSGGAGGPGARGPAELPRRVRLARAPGPRGAGRIGLPREAPHPQPYARNLHSPSSAGSAPGGAEVEAAPYCVQLATLGTELPAQVLAERGGGWHSVYVCVCADVCGSRWVRDAGGELRQARARASVRLAGPRARACAALLHIPRSPPAPGSRLCFPGRRECPPLGPCSGWPDVDARGAAAKARRVLAASSKLPPSRWPRRRGEGGGSGASCRAMGVRSQVEMQSVGGAPAPALRWNVTLSRLAQV